MSATDEPCAGDRVVLARRAGAESPEWQALAAHLQVCGDCRVAWQAMQWFDGAGSVRPGDERLVGRAVEAALAGRIARARPARRRGRRPALAIAASFVLAAAMASAGVALHRRWQMEPRIDPPAGSGSGSAPRRAGHRRASVVPVPAPAPVPTPAPAPAPVAPEPPALAVAPAPASTPPVRVARRVAALAPKNAPAAAARSPEAELFAQATAARREGRAADAVFLFRRLQRELSTTPEAAVSRVSLGDLLAEMGETEAALASFDAYLLGHPSGTLAPEAMAARARLLGRLGRAAEARASWQELRRRFPASPYGAGSGGTSGVGPP